MPQVSTAKPRRSDTSPEAERILDQIHRSMSVETKIKTILSLSDDLRKFTRLGIRHRHPDYTDRQVHLALNRIVLGDELFFKVFPGENVLP